MTSVTVRAIEAVQSIQNAANEVPLIAGKPTWVRVYLQADDLAPGTVISGRLGLFDGDREITGAVESLNPLDFAARLSLAEQRRDWDDSLNFRLPDSALVGREGETLRLRLQTAVLAAPGGADEQAAVEQADEIGEVKVAAATGLRCRILRFRCRDRDNSGFVEPTRGEAWAIRRYVDNAFPVSKADWSEIRLDAPRAFRALAPVARDSASAQAELTRWYMVFFQYMLALRECDIYLGRAADTLYLGLFDDPSGRFGGAAMDSPQFAAPHAVSMSTPDPEGDLGAHELAHALGRRHPGIPDSRDHGPLIGQRREPGSDQPASGTSGLSQAGFLSACENDDDGSTHIGLDTRFNRQYPELLLHDDYFDLMTYRYPKWVSDLTYAGLSMRLAEIENGDFELKTDDCCAAGAWSVIGEYDLEAKTGRIFCITRTRYKTPLPPAPDEHARILELAWPAAGEAEGVPVMATESIYLRHFDKLDGSPTVGVFQHTLGLCDGGRDAFRRIGGQAVSAANRDAFLQSLENMLRADGGLRLLLDGAAVDEIRPADPAVLAAVESGLERALDQAGEPGGHEACADTTGAFEIGLECSLDDDGYYLRYRWPRYEDAPELRAFTAIACRPERDSENDSGHWQTIAVSHARSDRVWISPAFFDGKKAKRAEHPIYGENFPGAARIRDLRLAVRISISVGFDTIQKDAVLRFPRGESAVTRRRDQQGGYLARPGSGAERAAIDASTGRDSRSWYRDRIKE